MRLETLTPVVVLFGLVMAGPSYSQGLHAVRPIPGYSCMALNLSEQQMNDPAIVVPILEKPIATAPMIGRATAIVIVTSPPRKESGFVQVLHLNGTSGWISTQYLKPWEAFGPVKQTCIPSIMSNGRVGFGFRNKGPGE